MSNQDEITYDYDDEIQNSEASTEVLSSDPDDETPPPRINYADAQKILARKTDVFVEETPLVHDTPVEDQQREYFKITFHSRKTGEKRIEFPHSRKRGPPSEQNQEEIAATERQYMGRECRPCTINLAPEYDCYSSDDTGDPSPQKLRLQKIQLRKVESPTNLSCLVKPLNGGTRS